MIGIIKDSKGHMTGQEWSSCAFQLKKSINRYLHLSQLTRDSVSTDFSYQGKDKMQVSITVAEVREISSD